MAFTYKLGPGIRKEVKRLLLGRFTGKKLQNLCTHDGVPQANSDLAAQNGDICYDTTNSDLYIASSVTSTTTTWTKFVG